MSVEAEGIFDEFLSDENGTADAAVEDDIEDDLAAYDTFLAQAGREQPAPIPESTSQQPPVSTLTTVPSTSQFSALSSSTNSSTAVLPGTKANSSKAGGGEHGRGTIPEAARDDDAGYGDDFEEGEEENEDGDNDDEEYADDMESLEKEAGVFLRIGQMTLTKTQAKLYGLKKSNKNSKFVVPSFTRQKPSGRNVKDRAAFRDKLARPVRAYTAKDKPKEFAKESEKVNCTFVPTKSRAAKAAMKSQGCGYDFLDNLDKDDGFIPRMDAFENYRRKKFRRDQERQIYDTSVDKKQCPNCGNFQSYDEWVDKRMQCCNDRCNRQFTYTVLNAFRMDGWEKRMGKSQQHAKATLQQLKRETEEDRQVFIVRTKVQEELIAKVSQKGKDFLQRMNSDINAKENKLKEKNIKNDKVFKAQCPFEPKLNVDKKWLKNRNPRALYATKDRVVIEAKPKKKKKAYVPPKKVVRRKKEAGEKRDESRTEEKPVRGIITAKEAEEEDKQMRAEFERLLL